MEVRTGTRFPLRGVRKKSESRRCRKGASEAFPLCVHCSDGEWVLGRVADVWLCSEGLEHLLQHSHIDVIKGSFTTAGDE